MRKARRAMRMVWAAMLLGAAFGAANAQSYPSKTVRIVVDRSAAEIPVDVPWR